MINEVLNFFLSGRPEPIDWDRKRLIDEQFAEMQMRQLEQATGRNRLDLAIDGYGNPDSPLNRNG